MMRKFKEEIKQNVSMVVLRNANSHSVGICKLIKNQVPGEKLIQILIFLFSKMYSVDEVSERRNVM